MRMKAAPQTKIDQTHQAVDGDRPLLTDPPCTLTRLVVVVVVVVGSKGA